MARLLPLMIQLLAGLGIGEIIDKFAPDSVKGYVPAERPRINDVPGVIKWLLFFAIAALVWRYVGKMLKVPAKFRI